MCIRDSDITSIQDFINDYTLTKYDATDINVYQANIFHTRLMAVSYTHLDVYKRQESVRRPYL